MINQRRRSMIHALPVVGVCVYIMERQINRQCGLPCGACGGVEGVWLSWWWGVGRGRRDGGPQSQEDRKREGEIETEEYTIGARTNVPTLSLSLCPVLPFLFYGFGRLGRLAAPYCCYLYIRTPLSDSDFRFRFQIQIPIPISQLNINQASPPQDRGSEDFAAGECGWVGGLVRMRRIPPPRWSRAKQSYVQFSHTPPGGRSSAFSARDEE